MDSHTKLYERDLEWAVQCARIDEVYEYASFIPEVSLYGYIDHPDGSLTLVTDENYSDYHGDDRVYWL